MTDQKYERPLPYDIPRPKGGWQTAFSDDEKRKLRPIAETLAMLDGNAFFGMGTGDREWYEQYLPEAHALYEANGGDNGWAGDASFARTARGLPLVESEERTP